MQKSRSPLRRPVAYDGAELLARIAWGFDCNRRQVRVTDYALGAQDNLVNADGIVKGDLPLDDRPDRETRPGVFLSQRNNTLPPLDKVPADVRAWAQTCAGKLNAAELRFLTAMFPASWYARGFRVRVSKSTGAAWHKFIEQVGHKALPLFRRSPDGRVVYADQGYYSTAEDAVRRIGRTKRGYPARAATAAKEIGKILQTAFSIEDAHAVSQYAKRRQAAVKWKGKFPAFGTVARVLGCSRMHAWRLSQSVEAKLRRWGAWNRLREFFGEIDSGRQTSEDDTARPMTDTEEIEVMLAEERLKMSRGRDLSKEDESEMHGSAYDGE